MNEGGRRQLPSWMLRQCTAAQPSNSEVKQQNSEVPLLENKSHVLEKSETRTRDRESSHQEADQHDEEPYLLKLGRTVKRKRTNKRVNDKGYNLPKSNLEADKGSRRKRYQGNSSGKKKKKKTGVSMEGSYDGAVPSEDELTVEDLVSIAEEYLSADMMEPENLRLNSKTRSEKDPTAQTIDLKPHTHNALSTKSSLTDPLCSEDSIIYDTGDPAQDMLNLLLGGFLKKSKEAEKKDDAITKNLILDYDVSRRSQYDTIGEVVPVVRKKASFKDKVAMLLD
ncbi:uncharacterized protein LOC141610810 [Silene latifolia]|uniref:uncharacterized protein LOC141610810 n=1 Tax=Silene latifolia TaxID=37657 RepID=UPI003D783828